MSPEFLPKRLFGELSWLSIFTALIILGIINFFLRNYLNRSLKTLISQIEEPFSGESLKLLNIGIDALLFRLIFRQPTQLLDSLAASIQSSKDNYIAALNRFREKIEHLELSDRKVSQEMNIARDIQLNMLMLTMPIVPEREEINLAAFLEPAQEIGGDLYDFYFFREETSFLIEENILCSYVGDVSGKGISASLFMATTRILLKDKSNRRRNPAEILTEVNQKLSENNPHCMFVTLFLSILDLSTGELYYTNAGHNPPYIKRHDGTLEILNQRHGPVIGIVSNMTYAESKTVLNRGDILIVYTDGITEAMNCDRQLFSELRLRSLLQNHAYHSAEEVVTSTIDEVRQFQGSAEQADDITLLCLRFLGENNKDTNRLEKSIKKDVLAHLREDWK
jgi:sigma-B regulation protein RsbU (phosphoserine phosphatase)